MIYLSDDIIYLLNSFRCESDKSLFFNFFESDKVFMCVDFFSIFEEFYLSEFDQICRFFSSITSIIVIIKSTRSTIILATNKNVDFLQIKSTNLSPLCNISRPFSKMISYIAVFVLLMLSTTNFLITTAFQSPHQYQVHRHYPHPHPHPHSSTTSNNSNIHSMVSASSGGFDNPKFFRSAIITTDVAKYGMAAAIQAGNQNNEFFTIVVADAGGHLLCAERMMMKSLGCIVMAQSVEIAQGKAKTAALFKKPTMALEDGCNGARPALLSAAGCTLMGGGVPLLYGDNGGLVLGAVGVSGLTPQNDQKYAQIAIDAMLSCL